MRQAGLTINSGIDRAVNGTNNAVNTVANGEFMVPPIPGQRERRVGQVGQLRLGQILGLGLLLGLPQVLSAPCEPPVTNCSSVLLHDCLHVCLLITCLTASMSACPRHPGQRGNQHGAAKRWQRNATGCGDNCKR